MKTRNLFYRVVTVIMLVAVLLPQGVPIPIRSAWADGPITFTEHTIASNLDSPESVCATDLDSDGDVDILGASANTDDITWWKNEGSENLFDGGARFQRRGVDALSPSLLSADVKFIGTVVDISGAIGFMVWTVEVHP